MIKKGIKLIKKFGLNIFLNKLFDLILIKLESKCKNWLYKRFYPKKTTEININVLGNDMLIKNGYGISRDLFLDRIREPVATSYVMKTLKPKDIVLDLGANIGYYVLIESKICKKVYAVEPVPENIKLLKHNVKQNKRKNVDIYELALGDQEGCFPIFLSQKPNWHSFQNKTDREINVDMDTVDNFLKDKEQPTFIRMDVEGFEVNVLRGMKETLKKVNRIFLEIHSNIMDEAETRECIDILKVNSFEPELIVKYDKPGFSRVMPNSFIKQIYGGYYGVYEVFFVKRKAKIKKV